MTRTQVLAHNILCKVAADAEEPASKPGLRPGRGLGALLGGYLGSTAGTLGGIAAIRAGKDPIATLRTEKIIGADKGIGLAEKLLNISGISKGKRPVVDWQNMDFAKQGPHFAPLQNQLHLYEGYNPFVTAHEVGHASPGKGILAKTVKLLAGSKLRAPVVFAGPAAAIAGAFASDPDSGELSTLSKASIPLAIGAQAALTGEEMRANLAGRRMLKQLGRKVPANFMRTSLRQAFGQMPMTAGLLAGGVGIPLLITKLMQKRRKKEQEAGGAV